MLRIDTSGKTNKVYIKRRDLLRRNRLLPRDLRRIDPSLSVVKTSPSINIKDHALLINLGGVRCGQVDVLLAGKKVNIKDHALLINLDGVRCNTHSAIPFVWHTCQYGLSCTCCCSLAVVSGVVHAVMAARLLQPGRCGLFQSLHANWPALAWLAVGPPHIITSAADASHAHACAG